MTVSPDMDLLTEGAVTSCGFSSAVSLNFSFLFFSLCLFLHQKGCRRSVVPSTGSPSSCYVFRSVSIVSPLTFTLTFVSDLHLIIQQLLSSHLVSSCFSESRVSATRLGGVLLSGWGPPAAGRQAEPTGSDPHSEQDVPAGVTGSEGGPGGRGGDLQSDFQDV